MGLFKRAAARGVAHELVRRGVVSFPSKEAADEAADAVADAMPEAGPQGGGMPEVSGDQGHSPEEIAEIANKLIEIAHALMAEASGGGAGGPPGMPPGAGGPPGGEMPPEIAKAAAELQKFASEYTLESIAGKVAVECMDKAAAEKQSGSLINGGDKQNTPEASKKVTEIGALDQKQRPSGAYENSRGRTSMPEGGAIGDLSKHPGKPHNTPAGSNSVTKGASDQMKETIRKIAGSLIHGGDKGNNTMEAAAKITEIAALENAQRPAGYAVVGKGNANFSEPQASRVGTEEKHPNGPHNTPAGTNSVIQASKTGGDLTEDEKMFVSLFSKCAEDVGPYLPEKLEGDSKVAAIRHMMGMNHDERQAYIDGLHGKQANEMTDALKAMHGDEGKKEEKHEKHEKSETPAEEKKEESKKEGALLEQIKKIAAAKSQQPRA
jgi:hypothetical protein